MILYWNSETRSLKYRFFQFLIVRINDFENYVQVLNLLNFDLE